MNKKFRVGIIGFAHMHVNNVVSLYAQHPQVELVACADIIPDEPELREAPYTRAWNLKNVLTNIGVPKAYDDYHEMLEKEHFDIIICCSENAKHLEVVEACAAEKANVQIEKPMAMCLSDALRMVRACQVAGTTMIINWPLTWSPVVHKAKTLIDKGIIGRVLEVKLRSDHTGPLGPEAAHAGVSEKAVLMTGPERGATWWHQKAAGGGAMLDFCCYGSMVSRWYIGESAIAVMGLKANLDSHWGNAEDNATMIIRFPHAIGLSEGSWTTWDSAVSNGPIIYGTKGTLVVETKKGKPVVRLERGHVQTTIYEPESLPEGRRQAPDEFIHHLETGELVHYTLGMMFNLEVMGILDAGARSASSGKLEMVDSATWQIG